MGLGCKVFEILSISKFRRDGFVVQCIVFVIGPRQVNGVEVDGCGAQRFDVVKFCLRTFQITAPKLQLLTVELLVFQFNTPLR